MTMKIHQSFALQTVGLASVLLFYAGRVLAQNVPEVEPHVVVVQFEAGILSSWQNPHDRVTGF